MLGGTVTLNGCQFFEVNGFGYEIGMGTNVAVLAGVFMVNFCHYYEVNLATQFHAVGEAFLVAGEDRRPIVRVPKTVRPVEDT
jgi:hypothetical protein